MNNIEILVGAINNGRSISFEYQLSGKIRGLRIGDPYILYKDPLKVAEVKPTVKLELIQTAGVTNSFAQAPFPSVRQFDVANIDKITVLEREINWVLVKSLFNPQAARYQEALAQVMI